MARREIVQKPVVKIFDDYSGNELPETTKPVRSDFNGRAYHLYLSDESKRAVDSFIAELTDGADEIVTGLSAPPAPHPGIRTVCERFGGAVIPQMIVAGALLLIAGVVAGRAWGAQDPCRSWLWSRAGHSDSIAAQNGTLDECAGRGGVCVPFAVCPGRCAWRLRGRR